MAKLFVYLKHNGAIEAQILHQGMLTPKGVLQTQKLTEDDNKLTINELKLKYPMKESKENA